MKYFNVLAALFLIASPAFATLSPIHNGDWEGTGKWTSSDGKTGTYEVKWSVDGDSMKAEATYDGKTHKSEGKVTLDKNGFGTLEMSCCDGGECKSCSAEGFCGEHACSFYNKKENFGFSTHFCENGASTIGGKEFTGGKVRWEETLKKK